VSAAFLSRAPSADRVRVKRDGPRGWHWISAAHFDPAKHELMDAPAAAAPAQQDRPRRGRPPKQHPPEATNGDR